MLSPMSLDSLVKSHFTSVKIYRYMWPQPQAFKAYNSFSVAYGSQHTNLMLGVPAILYRKNILTKY